MPDLSLLSGWADIAAALIAFLGLLGLIWQDRRFRDRRALTCNLEAIHTPVHIWATNAELRKDIKIRYKGKKIKSLFVMQARLKNTGNVPIRKVHVVEPLTFTFHPGAELYDEPLVVYKYPCDLEVSWFFSETGPNSKPSTVSLDFELLNPGDELLVEFVWDGQPIEPKVSARIEGMRKIDSLDPKLMFKRMELITRLYVAAVLLGLGWLTVTVIFNPSGFILGLVVGFLLAGVVGYTAQLIRIEQVRRGLRDYR
jgi:hypothetical protein